MPSQQHAHIHIVMLNENLATAFFTFDRDEAETAASELLDVFGANHQVSGYEIELKSIDEYRELISTWKADPRMKARTRSDD